MNRNFIVNTVVLFQRLVAVYRQTQHGNIDENTLYWRHVSAQIVAISRPYANVRTKTDYCTWV
jgi:hypothetical protein